MDEEERHAGIVAMLENEADTESEEEFEELDSQSEEEEADASSDEHEEDEDPVEASDDDEEDGDEEGHRVPYGRFKRINDQRHELRGQLEEKERFIAELESRIQARKAPEPEHEEYGEIFEDEDSSDSSYEGELSHLREQNHAIQVKFATMELEKEIAAAQEQYPSVPADYLWETIAQDGSQSATNIAKQYSAWVAEVEEGAIARYLDNESDGSANAPPRPSRKQTAKSDSGEKAWTPSNTDEAREAMIAYLKV